MNRFGGAPSREHGFGAISAVIVLVMLAALAAALVRFGSVAQNTSAQALLAARALQAARAGIEWGLYQSLKGSWNSCGTAMQTLDLKAETGFAVTVRCDSRLFNEGESAAGVARTVRLYTIDATACNASTACPDNVRATAPGYVERRLQVHATD